MMMMKETEGHVLWCLLPIFGKTTKEDKVLCKLCDCPWLYTNEVTECVLLSMLLRQLFSSLFRPL